MLGTTWQRLGPPGAAVQGGLALVAGLCYLTVLLRLRPAWNTPLLAVVAVAAGAMHGVEPYSGLAFAFVLPWITAFSVPVRHVVVVGLLDAAGVLVASFGLGLETWAGLGTTFGLLFSVAFAVAVQQLSVIREQSEVAARARASEAVFAERQRLAREMHDILAHSLSAQSVHLEGARLLLERGSDPADALERVTRAGQLARAGLEETRRALDTLRGDEVPLADRLEELAGDFAAATGARCRVTVSGDLATLVPEARLAVVRTAQEALTNVRKHAPGAEVALALRCRDRWCELNVQDTGGAPGEFRGLGSGYGLIGMRERAELLGGSLDASPNGTGFRVLLRVPA